MKLPKGYVPGVGLVKSKGGFGGFGEKMLEKMGWQRGQGLGKEKKGMKDAIEVTKKEDTLGVGATATGWKWDWKYWEDAYNGAAQTIDHNGSGGSGSDSDSDSDSDAGEPASGPSSRAASGRGASTSSSSSSDSSDEDEPALGRLMAAAVAVNRDGTLATATADELAIAQGLAKGPWVAGRFGGREGKMARIRAQEERQAAEARSKLGVEAPAAAAGGGGGGAAAAAGKKRKPKAVDEAAGAGAGDADGGKRSKKAKKAAKEEAKKAAAAAQQQQQQQGEQQQEQGQGPQAQEQQRPKGKVIIVALKGSDAERPALPFKPTPASGWWGEKMFASAGRLEGMDEEEAAAQEQRLRDGASKPAPKRAAFDEDTQADLYNRLQAAQRQGKRGMGKAAVKIAGGNWEGTKKTFEDEEDGGDGGGGGGGGGGAADPAAEAAAAAGGDSAGEGARRRKKDKKNSKKAEAAASSGKRKVKWVRLAAEQLKRAPKRRLKWSALWAALWERDDVAALGCGAKEAKEAAWAKISASGKVKVSGNKVKLVEQ